ncbi:hypothetical protein Patl1_24690 [Pistacia atlantica]|uniref:Uncharacterized protein n=1 Tax=Pistacia atlantica TaxID=434234 RepID=A0ACC1AYQ6_9ROSI|nr:hypothetical protein Patl1_24690 [Pistacia atlantica]
MVRVEPSDPRILFTSDGVIRQIEIPFGSKTRHFKWEVEYMFRTPDRMEHGSMGINGQFPGPTIRAKAGDTISVEVTNKLHTEGIVIHWHGITQIGTPWIDGTPYISQYGYAINPGETFIYRNIFLPWTLWDAKISKAVWISDSRCGRSRKRLDSCAKDAGGDGDGDFAKDRAEGGLKWQPRDEGKRRRWEKLLMSEDKDFGESKASVHGSTSKTSPSEEYSQDYRGP